MLYYAFTLAEGGAILGDDHATFHASGIHQVAVLSYSSSTPASQEAAPPQELESEIVTASIDAISETVSNKKAATEQVEKPKPEAREAEFVSRASPKEQVSSVADKISNESLTTSNPTTGRAAGSGELAKKAGEQGRKKSKSEIKAEENYYRTLMVWLNKHKTYPTAARKAKQEGISVLKFTIDRDGNVLSAKVTKSSGFSVLDQATLDMMERASPLPPIPESMRRDSLSISLPIEFSLVTE